MTATADTADTAADLRPAHRTVEHGDHRLRITRWAPGAANRDVFRVMADGSLVQLGTVTDHGHGTFMAYCAPEANDRRGYGCESYVDGARLLDARLEVHTLTLHTLSVRHRTEA